NRRSVIRNLVQFTPLESERHPTLHWRDRSSRPNLAPAEKVVLSLLRRICRQTFGQECAEVLSQAEESRLLRFCPRKTHWLRAIQHRTLSPNRAGPPSFESSREKSRHRQSPPQKRLHREPDEVADELVRFARRVCGLVSLREPPFGAVKDCPLRGQRQRSL